MADTKAFNLTDTIKRYGSQLFGFIKSKVGLVEDAEDILQDVWYQYSNLANPEEILSVSGWLYRVAKNRIIDRSRKQKNLLLDDLVYEGEEGELSLKDVLLSNDTDDVEIFMFQEEFWNTLQIALEELPENQRRVFIQNELEDKTLREIAEEEGVPIKTIVSRKGYYQCGSDVFMECNYSGYHRLEGDQLLAIIRIACFI